LTYSRPKYVSSNPSLGIADIDEGYDYHCSVGNEAQGGLVARGCYEPKYVLWCDDPVLIQICWCPNIFYFQCTRECGFDCRDDVPRRSAILSVKSIQSKGLYNDLFSKFALARLDLG